tara:strand:+ start:6639 stop:6896 length:258 start_codon:yes stop_codon:yes gene_type:complete
VKTTQKTTHPKNQKFDHDEIILRSKIEIGDEYEYSIHHGGIGKSLHVLAPSKEEASKLRKIIPSYFCGCRTIVTYYNIKDDFSDV